MCEAVTEWEMLLSNDILSSLTGVTQFWRVVFPGVCNRGVSLEASRTTCSCPSSGRARGHRQTSCIVLQARTETVFLLIHESVLFFVEVALIEINAVFICTSDRLGSYEVMSTTLQGRKTFREEINKVSRSVFLFPGHRQNLRRHSKDHLHSLTSLSLVIKAIRSGLALGV